MKKIAAAVIVALTPIFTWAQSLGDTIQLDVNGESIEATLAEQLSSPNSYRLTFETSSGDTQHLGFMHKRGENQLISITHPKAGSVIIRTVKGKTVVETTNLPPAEPKQPKIERKTPTSVKAQALPQKSYSTKKSAAPADEVQLFDSSLDVLFIYDDRLLGYAEENNYDLELAVQSAVDTSNEIFERSNLPISMTVAGLEPFRPESTTDFPNETPDTILDELIDDQRVIRLIDRYKADVVHFVGAENPDLCGIAFRASDFNTTDNRVNFVSGGSNAGYTAIDCMGSGTVAHEVGHNFGLRHDRYTLADNSSGGEGDQEDFHIPYGFIDDEGRFFTTMSYGSVCRSEFSSGECFSEAAFSSPDIVDNNYGLPLGKAESELDAANASLAAQRSSVIWTNNSSRMNLAGMQTARTGNDVLTFSWRRVENADKYVVAGGACEQYTGLSQAALLAEEGVTNNAVAYQAASLPDAICIIAVEQINPDTARWRFVSNASFSGDYTDAAANYLLLNNNVLSLVEAGDQAQVTIELSDEATTNASLQLALLVTASGTDVSQQIGIDNAAEWFSWEVTGSGTTRTMTVTLKQSVADISAGLDKDNVHNPYHLPLKVVNTEVPDFSVSSGLWIDPDSMTGGAAQAFISQGERVGEVMTLDSAISVYNVPENVAITVDDTDGVIQNFTAAEIDPAVEGERRIQLTGETPAVDQALSVPLQVNFSDGSGSINVSFTVEPRAIAPTIRSFRASNTIAGQTVSLTATVTDADGNLDASSIEVVRLNSDGSETSVSNVNYEGDTVSASLGSLSTGDYEYRLTASDTEGNSETATTSFTVTEASSGSSGGNAAWLLLLAPIAWLVRRKSVT
ncbi:peptidase [Idiomarina sp. WRN-38]|uniref:zinc-dependent metalloprotease family protein n=1 Tax=unclassified Idiomarina TaxID=2614829 RepID=UPI00073378DE|nr:MULTISPECIES: zinc-dependent metalloprotease family protein [unclassified Idiomarina]KTG29979.1 peptidase [Idiomarina sp. H105]OAF14373.1 peptidase [Idiomarina sp. WRN-38]MCJ8317774.1 M12 family metallo-peptidase [Idiomarina sp.]NQZ17447.1 peptidase [Idiomarina sp.]WPZ01849.1 zinc-dependent metalloprotease family protein [Idiomarina sp. OXR-189]